MLFSLPFIKWCAEIVGANYHLCGSHLGKKFLLPKQKQRESILSALLKLHFKPGMVVDTFNPSTQKARQQISEFKASLIYKEVLGQPELHREIPSQKLKKEEKKEGEKERKERNSIFSSEECRRAQQGFSGWCGQRPLHSQKSILKCLDRDTFSHYKYHCGIGSKQQI